MQSLLVKLATVAVMVHMTLGCHWHHGLGVQLCSSECSNELCQHPGESSSENCCGEHESSGLADTDSTIGEDRESHGHCHFSCLDDGCSAIQLSKFKIWSTDYSTACFPGAGNFALAMIQTKSVPGINPFPDCSHSATPVRAHLLFCVQLI